LPIVEIIKISIKQYANYF